MQLVLITCRSHICRMAQLKFICSSQGKTMALWWSFLTMSRAVGNWSCPSSCQTRPHSAFSFQSHTEMPRGVQEALAFESNLGTG